MAQQNVEVVRRLFEAYNQGDLDATGRGRGSGIDLDDRLFDVYTLRDARVVHKAEFRERAEALAAAGLRGRLPS